MSGWDNLESAQYRFNPSARADGTDRMGHAESMTIRIDRWREVEPPVADELKSRLRSEGYTVFQWSNAPGTNYGPHAHPEDQSHWILSGELELRVGHETYILRAGDRDFLPANTIHSAFVPGDEPVTYLIGAKH